MQYDENLLEFFEIDEEAFLEYLDSFEYGELLRGETSTSVERYEMISSAIRKENESKHKSEKGTNELPF